MGQADGFRAARPALTVSRSCRLALRGLALLLLRCSLAAGSGPGDGVRWATRRSLRGGRAGFCLEFGAGCFATDCLDKRLAVGVRDCYDRSSELLPVGPVIDVTFGESVSIRVVNRVQYTDSGDPSFYSSFPGCEPGDDIDLSALPANVSDNDYPGISIHWHGINQNGSQWYDGTAYFTQCPTVYGNELTYDFEINDKPGTYWYHAHVQDLASDGMQGALIIRERTSGVGTPGTCEDDWDKSLTNGEPVHELGPLTVIDWYNKSWLAIHNGLWNPESCPTARSPSSSTAGASRPLLPDAPLEIARGATCRSTRAMLTARAQSHSRQHLPSSQWSPASGIGFVSSTRATSGSRCLRSMGTAST